MPGAEPSGTGHWLLPACLRGRPARLDGELPDGNRPEPEFGFAARRRGRDPWLPFEVEHIRLTGGQ